MKDNSKTSIQLIADFYEKYHHSVFLYISYRINDREEAEDLSQDVFLRLMDYKQMLRPDTIKFFIYTIARNLVIDYLRIYYRKREYSVYQYDNAARCTNEVESHAIAADLLSREKGGLKMLPAQRRKVYVMSRFGERTVSEISAELNLSSRTVENHLFAARKEVREYMRQCI